jgi:hypothetical protein
MPIKLISVDNFYAPIRTLCEASVAAGFIKAENLSHLTIVDIDNTKAGREEEASLWGEAVVKALNEWKPPVRDTNSTKFKLTSECGRIWTTMERSTGGRISTRMRYCPDKKSHALIADRIISGTV